jgi:hypothetical protein
MRRVSCSDCDPEHRQNHNREARRAYLGGLAVQHMPSSPIACSPISHFCEGTNPHTRSAGRACYVYGELGRRKLLSVTLAGHLGARG